MDNEDTEWNDILRARGIIPAKEGPTEEELRDIVDEAIAAKKAADASLSDKELDELDELEDLEDDRVLLHYRQQRLQEMQQAAEKAKYGELVEISRPDFVREVSEASKECSVVVYLYKDQLPICKIMNEHLKRLAAKNKNVKFVKIVSDQCIPNYPDYNVPTLLIYGKGDIQANLVGAVRFGGMKMTEETLRQQLVGAGVLEDTQKKKKEQETPKKIIRNSATAALSSDDESSDND